MQPTPLRATLRVRAFRFQWLADLCTAWALEMEALVLGWTVLEQSGSVGLLTLFGALLYVGTLVSPLLGTLGDRIGLARLLAGMRLVYALGAATVLALALTGRLSPPAVLGVAFVVGLVKPSDIGMRSALAAATVPPALLVPVMSISRTTQDSARVAGALAGTGTLAAFGLAPAYVAVLLLYGLGMVLVWPVRHAVPAVPTAAATGEISRPSPWRELVEGLQLIWRTPQLLAAITLAALANLTAFPLTGGLMPYVARDVFGLGATGLGWLVASWAGGALAGSLAVSRFGAHMRPARSMLVSAVLWYLALLGLALPIGVPQAMLHLAAAGAAQSVSMLSLAVLLMRCADARFRGRVMGVRMLAIYTLPVGLLTAGWAIPQWGFRAVAAASCGLGLLMLAGVALGWRRHLWPRAAAANAAAPDQRRPQ